MDKNLIWIAFAGVAIYYHATWLPTAVSLLRKLFAWIEAKYGVDMPDLPQQRLASSASSTDDLADQIAASVASQVREMAKRDVEALGKRIADKLQEVAR